MDNVCLTVSELNKPRSYCLKFLLFSPVTLQNKWLACYASVLHFILLLLLSSNFKLCSSHINCCQVRPPFLLMWVPALWTISLGTDCACQLSSRHVWRTWNRSTHSFHRVQQGTILVVLATRDILSVEKEMETDASIGWPFLETLVEGVCSSSTGETKMAQTSTKRASRRPSTSSGSRPTQGKVAFGPYCQGDSRKRWARANSWSEDRIFLVVAATHTETLSVRGSREPLPWLRLIRMKNWTLSLLLLLIDFTDSFVFFSFFFFFWELTPSLNFWMLH